MTRQSGGDSVDGGPAPGPDRDRAGGVAGNVRDKGQDPSPDDPERGGTADSDGNTARERAS
ncbi:MAG TPA: hypothetical protein VF605_04575 [Allosphingosinicella sp.]|jgi:hypothetical protein